MLHIFFLIESVLLIPPGSFVCNHVVVVFCWLCLKSATINLLQRPVDIINRKRPSAVWFPYNTLEQLWCQLDGLINLGHMVDQCDKLKRLLHGALLNHLKQVCYIGCWSLFCIKSVLTANHVALFYLLTAKGGFRWCSFFCKLKKVIICR